MSPFIADDHVNWLLQQVEVELLIRLVKAIAKVSINEGLRSGIEERIDISLVPTRLFNRLKSAEKVVHPLFDVALIRL
jgi:hypothetical protein